MGQKDSDNSTGEDEAAGSSSGRLPVIKIRIPKKADEEVRSHYCKECNKSFNSGKALGGHMSSAHVQANKDYSMKKVSSNSKRKSPGSPTTACMLCGKVFQSEKSLFGHMRCHPEREWRGMEPPREMKDDSGRGMEPPREMKDDSGHELGLFNLKGWPTSKRGRAPVSSNSVVQADSGPFVAGLELIKRLKEDDDDEPREIKGKDKVPEIDPTDELYITAIQVLVSGKRERVMGEMGMDPDKYKCNECGRVFPTHQALGGHRSSHNKFKITVVNTNTRDLEPEMKKEKKKKIKVNIIKSNGDAASTSAGAFAFDLNMAPAEEDMEDSSNS